MALERVEHVVPQRRFFGRLNLRQIEDDAAALGRAGRRWLLDVERDVDDRGGQALAAGEPHVTIVEVQAARPEDPRREIELRAPVLDDRPAEEALRPGVHLAGDLLGGGHEHVGPRERQLQVALVVERHAVDLPERVLAVEHPAVGARQQRVGDVADALGGRGARPRRGTGALDPLPLQIGRDLAAVEAAGPGVAHADAGAADRRVRRQERDALALTLAPGAPLDARSHELTAIGIERRERRDRVERGRREHVSVVLYQSAANPQWSGRVHRGLLSQGSVREV